MKEEKDRKREEEEQERSRRKRGGGKREERKEEGESGLVRAERGSAQLLRLAGYPLCPLYTDTGYFCSPVCFNHSAYTPAVRAMNTLH
jgi:hypothetical protein